MYYELNSTGVKTNYISMCEKTNYYSMCDINISDFMYFLGT